MFHKKIHIMDFVTSLKTCFSKYATFSGRARRSEFWWFALAAFIGSLIPVLGYVISLACIIPNIAVGVRRLHDIGKSGWFYLLALIPVVGALILIYWFVQDSAAGDNEYGANPKA